jgi:hypothetical protein
MSEQEGPDYIRLFRETCILRENGFLRNELSRLRQRLDGIGYWQQCPADALRARIYQLHVANTKWSRAEAHIRQLKKYGHSATVRENGRLVRALDRAERTEAGLMVENKKLKQDMASKELTIKSLSRRVAELEDEICLTKEVAKSFEEVAAIIAKAGAE